jgi:hypothetical protein
MVNDSYLALERMGLDVLHVPAVINFEDVANAIAYLHREEYDAILLVLVSWVEAPLLIATLRPFRTVPMVLWSHTSFMDGTSRVTLGALPAAGVNRESLEEMSFRFRFVYGMPDEQHLANGMLPYVHGSDGRAGSCTFQDRSLRVRFDGYVHRDH